MKQYTVTKLEPKLSNDPEENASICEAAGYVSKYRAEAREADGTFLEQGIGATDTLATAALVGDLAARVPQQGTAGGQEKMLRHCLRALQAWDKRMGSGE